MAFYPLLLGHAECRIDRRDPRPWWLVEYLARGRRGGRRR
jgi:hypothetical protein